MADMARAPRGAGDVPRGSRILLRWLGVAVVAFVAFLYSQPLRSYLSTRDALSSSGPRRSLAPCAKAAARAAARGARHPAALRARARRIGVVKPGERLFIVKGIAAGAHARAAAQTPAMDDRGRRQQLGRPPRALRAGRHPLSIRTPGRDRAEPVRLGRASRSPRRTRSRAATWRPSPALEAAGGVERWSERLASAPELRASLEQATRRQRQLRRELAGADRP